MRIGSRQWRLQFAFGNKISKNHHRIYPYTGWTGRRNRQFWIRWHDLSCRWSQSQFLDPGTGNGEMLTGNLVDILPPSLIQKLLKLPLSMQASPYLCVRGFKHGIELQSDINGLVVVTLQTWSSASNWGCDGFIRPYWRCEKKRTHSKLAWIANRKAIPLGGKVVTMTWLGSTCHEHGTVATMMGTAAVAIAAAATTNDGQQGTLESKQLAAVS